MNENISNQDDINQDDINQDDFNEDEAKAYILNHREELGLDEPEKQIDFFEEVKRKLQNFNFKDEFDYTLLTNYISGTIRKTFDRLMPDYKREDFEKKTEVFNQLLKTYRIYKIVSRFCDENKLDDYVSTDIKFPAVFETEYKRIFPDDNSIILSRNSAQSEPERDKAGDSGKEKSDAIETIPHEDRVARAKVKEFSAQNRALKKRLSLKYDLDHNELIALIDEARHPKTGRFSYRKLGEKLSCHHSTAKRIVERNGLKHLTE
ncbi:MAG TPA: hypothetical protein P5268_06330 [Candidatus Marinimicrobia bacterium]|nr:hypothetical protein [Candidatus Neomarinimicrobiota bacterium]HRS51819.1 hypothetical protein [Candidatus Neomarinimicrobiota bacterium]HRU92629.1 hypothetical protein [Candidatus Neomarinimicrobiota bacterium]